MTWLELLGIILGGAAGIGTIGGVLYCCCCRESNDVARKTGDAVIVSDNFTSVSSEESETSFHESTESINSEKYNEHVKFVADAEIDMPSYNCWGWAIQKITGNYINGNPPDYFMGCTVKQLANMTKKGVEQTGKAHAEILEYLDNDDLNRTIQNLKSHEYLIAMRVGSCVIGKNLKTQQNVVKHFYHYMRFDKNLNSSGEWTHKAGPRGAIYNLKSTIDSNNYLCWTSPLSQISEDTTRIKLSDNPRLDSRIYKDCPTWYVKVIMNML